MTFALSASVKIRSIGRQWRAISKLSFTEMEQPVEGHTQLISGRVTDVSGPIQIYHSDQIVLTFCPIHR